MTTKIIRLAWIATLAVAAAGAAVSTARADDPPACPSSANDAYTMTARALTGPKTTDVELRFTAAAGCAAVDRVDKVQLKTFTAEGKLAGVHNLRELSVSDGVATATIDRVEHGRRIEADALLQTGTPPRTYVLHEVATSLLRPDLVVEPVKPLQTLTTRPIAVDVVVAEVNGDMGATAKVTLGPIAGTGETKEVTVGADGRVVVDFTALSFKTPMPVELTVRIDDVVPGEADTTNNTRTVTVDVTEHELPQERIVLFPSLVGYGAQFNHHLYAPITEARMPLGAYADVEQKVKALDPQLVRIFYSDNWEENADGKHPSPEYLQNYASFVKVVELAQEAGATIDISYQNLANAKLTPEAAMAKYAQVLQDLVKNHGLTSVRWAEVGNEPNSGAVTLAEYNALYRALHAQLVARGLRDHIHLMGGGLVENAGNPARTHYAWGKWIAANMGDIVDAYAEHVYWNFNDTGRLEYRLRDTANLMNTVLPPDQRKPTYMMEFGVRGLGTCGTKPVAANTYYNIDPTCPEIWRTNIGAFQQFWFAVHSAQLGVAGAAKWDAYWAVYDNTLNPPQVYWMTGPASDGYPVTPTYNVMSLLFHATIPGWQIIGVEPWDSSDWSVPKWEIEGHGSNDQREKELAAYAGPNGAVTIIGLDTNGRNLNGVSGEPPVAYSIGGLPRNTDFRLALWNASGDGTNSIAGTVTTSAAGVARFEVPLQAAFALTTVPVS